jgi:serine/threonine protein kinase
MKLVGSLVCFGLRQVLDVGADEVVEAVEQHFTDHAETLPRALRRANDRTWQALAVALGGDSWFDRVKRWIIADKDQRAFREQVRKFLDAKGVAFNGSPPNLHDRCLEELQQAMRAGDLSAEGLTPQEVGRETAGFAKYADPQGLVTGAEQAVAAVARALQPRYPNLATLLSHPTPGGPPLLVAAFCFFFRQEVQSDQRLANDLMYDNLKRLSRTQAAGFESLGQALDGLGGRFEEALGEMVAELTRVREEAERARKAAEATHGAVRDLQDEVRRLGGMHLVDKEEVRNLFEEVIARLARAGIRSSEMQPEYSFSIRGDDERRAVKLLLGRLRRLPEQDRRQLPALLNGVGELQAGTGDLAGAGQTFDLVARTASDPVSKAKASYNAYRVALEEKKWKGALEALQQAAEMDPQQFAPFPLYRYEPRQILGAGGFGTAFLCRDRNLEEDVVVKTLHADGLDRCPAAVFREARVLRGLSHPGIISVQDCGYADPMSRTRPYLVFDHFPGVTLQQFVEQQGTLTPEQFLPLGLHIARAMHAAHAQGILHRDLKPGNILVLPAGDDWRVKVIDFGLALPLQTIQTSMAGTAKEDTVLTRSIAGTILYAPPEQMGRMPGAQVGRHSDVYAFGKTCCYALFGMTEPTRRHWTGIPAELADVLETCIEQDLGHRHASFEPVLAVLEALSLMSLAEDYLQEGAFDLTINTLTEALSHHPGWASAYVLRGQVHQRKGESYQAIADLTEAIRFGLPCATAYLWRGQAYSQQGNHDLAIADLTEAIRLDPESAEAYAARGRAYRLGGQSGLATGDLTQAHILAPPEMRDGIWKDLEELLRQDESEDVA